jgi:septation ring formation regulator EzrA
VNDKELGIIIGKLDSFQNEVHKRFNEQRDNFSKIFQKLENHSQRITVVEEKTKSLGKVLWVIPTLIALILTGLGLWLRYG